MQHAPGMNASLDVLEILQRQHSELDDLFEQLQSGEGDRRALLLELADKLAAHAAVEEKLFYPAVMTVDTSDQLHESVEDHLAIKRLLVEMVALDPDLDRDELDARLAGLAEEVSRHAHEEEEAKLFPKVRRILDAEQRAALGEEVLAMFEPLVIREPSNAESASLPSRELRHGM